MACDNFNRFLCFIAGCVSNVWSCHFPPRSGELRFSTNRVFHLANVQRSDWGFS